MDSITKDDGMDAVSLVVKQNQLSELSGSFEYLAGLDMVSETPLLKDNIYANINGICNGIEGYQPVFSVTDDWSNGIISNISYFSWKSNQSAFVAGVTGLTANSFKSGYSGYYYQNSKLFDAEKCTSITKDDEMCWAATAANMLEYAGWDINTSNTEDSILTIFINNFMYGDKYGGRTEFGIEWFFTGNYAASGWSRFDEPQSGTGGYYKDFFVKNKLSDYLSTTTFSVSGLKTAKEKLENGYAVGISFGYYNSTMTNRNGGHAVTLWGLTYNTSLSVTDPNYFTGIIISDSDDDKNKYSVGTSAPDTIKIISIYYDSSKQQYYLDPAYAGNYAYLEDIVFLAPYKEIATSGINIYSSGTLTSSGDIIENADIQAGGNNSAYIYSGGVLSSFQIKSGGVVYVHSGGSAKFCDIYSKGCLHVSSGAIVDYSYVSSGGSLFLSSAAKSKNNRVYDGGCTVVYSGAVASKNIVSNGKVFVEGGQYLNNNVSGTNAYLGVYSQGYTSKTTLVSNCSMKVFSNGTAEYTTVSSAKINAGDYAKISQTTILSGGTLNISNFASAYQNYISSGGKMFVSSGGSAYLTSVYSGGAASAYSGGVVSAAMVCSGGMMNLAKGAIIQGNINLGGNMVVTGKINAANAAINLRICDRKTTDSYIISNLSLISQASYTITVSSTQSTGTYKLATEASDFTGSFTIKDSNNSQYGSLSIGKSLVYNGNTYTLSNVEGNLSLVISNNSIYDISAVETSYSLGDPINISIVTGTFDDSSKITTSDNIYIDWHIDNNGDAITESFKTALYLDNVLIKTWNTYDLNKGYSAYVDDYNLGKLTAGTHTVKIVTDCENVIIETNENNNTYYKTFYVSPRVLDDDLDGNGLADTVLVHTKKGFSGAWLSTGDKSVIKWGDLGNVNGKVEVVGMGNVKGTTEEGADIYLKIGTTVAAWVTDSGKVKSYKELYTLKSNMNMLGIGDFDGDGVTDYLLRSKTGDLGYVTGDDNKWHYIKGLGKEWKISAVGDLDGNGTDDVIVRHDAGFTGAYMIDTNGKITWSNLDTLKSDMTLVGTGDFNGDGIDDVLLQNKSNGWVGAWIVEDGNVDSFIGICKNKNSIEQIADFNGDGIDDLRIRTDKGDIGVLYVKGADTTEWKYFQSVGKEWDTSFALIS